MADANFANLVFIFIIFFAIVMLLFGMVAFKSESKSLTLPVSFIILFLTIILFIQTMRINENQDNENNTEQTSQE